MYWRIGEMNKEQDRKKDIPSYYHPLVPTNTPPPPSAPANGPCNLSNNCCIFTPSDSRHRNFPPWLLQSFLHLPDALLALPFFIKMSPPCTKCGGSTILLLVRVVQNNGSYFWWGAVKACWGSQKCLWHACPCCLLLQKQCQSAPSPQTPFSPPTWKTSPSGGIRLGFMLEFMSVFGLGGNITIGMRQSQRDQRC